MQAKETNSPDNSMNGSNPMNDNNSMNDSNPIKINYPNTSINDPNMSKIEGNNTGINLLDSPGDKSFINKIINQNDYNKHYVGNTNDIILETSNANSDADKSEIEQTHDYSAIYNKQYMQNNSSTESEAEHIYNKDSGEHTPTAQPMANHGTTNNKLAENNVSKLSDFTYIDQKHTQKNPESIPPKSFAKKAQHEDNDTPNIQQKAADNSLTESGIILQLNQNDNRPENKESDNEPKSEESSNLSNTVVLEKDKPSQSKIDNNQHITNQSKGNIKKDVQNDGNDTPNVQQETADNSLTESGIVLQLNQNDNRPENKESDNEPKSEESSNLSNTVVLEKDKSSQSKIDNNKNTINQDKNDTPTGDNIKKDVQNDENQNEKTEQNTITERTPQEENKTAEEKQQQDNSQTDNSHNDAKQVQVNHSNNRVIEYYEYYDNALKPHLLGMTSLMDKLHHVNYIMKDIFGWDYAIDTDSEAISLTATYAALNYYRRYKDTHSVSIALPLSSLETALFYASMVDSNKLKETYGIRYFPYLSATSIATDVYVYSRINDCDMHITLGHALFSTAKTYSMNVTSKEEKNVEAKRELVSLISQITEVGTDTLDMLYGEIMVAYGAASIACNYAAKSDTTILNALASSIGNVVNLHVGIGTIYYDISNSIHDGDPLSRKSIVPLILNSTEYVAASFLWLETLKKPPVVAHTSKMIGAVGVVKDVSSIAATKALVEQINPLRHTYNTYESYYYESDTKDYGNTTADHLLRAVVCTGGIWMSYKVAVVAGTTAANTLAIGGGTIAGLSAGPVLVVGLPILALVSSQGVPLITEAGGKAISYTASFVDHINDSLPSLSMEKPQIAPHGADKMCDLLEGMRMSYEEPYIIPYGVCDSSEGMRMYGKIRTFYESLESKEIHDALEEHPFYDDICPFPDTLLIYEAY